jgi:hypothetical protein
MKTSAGYGDTHTCPQLLKRWRQENYGQWLAQEKHKALTEKQTKSKWTGAWFKW